MDSDVHKHAEEGVNINKVSSDDITSEIIIGNKVWIGGNCTILKGVNIGNGAVIGAGSVVSKDVPPNVLATGNPCKIMKENYQWKP
jgi:acetyltransferase-like isoleucine patch superfamily enzyme